MSAAFPAHPVVADATRIARERQFSPEGGDDAVLRALAHLAREHASGTVLIDLSCGGVAMIRFREERRVDF